jgi:hypothetical protein
MHRGCITSALRAVAASARLLQKNPRDQTISVFSLLVLISSSNLPQTQQIRNESARNKNL